MSLGDAMYFATQRPGDVNCVTLAINNLFGTPIVTRNTLLGMKITKQNGKKNSVCWDHGRGISCQNEVIGEILKLVQNGELNVTEPIKSLFENTTAMNWADLRQTHVRLNHDQFDKFFKLFNKYIVGIYGNISHISQIGHAVCVRRRAHKRGLWLLDSLNETRKRVSRHRLPVRTYNFQPFVVILDDRYFDITMLSP